MRSPEYWAERFEQVKKSQIGITEDYLEVLKSLYIAAMLAIEKDITVWYTRLAKNNNVSYADALEMLSAKELAEFRWTLKDYIKYAELNQLSGAWVKQLENASARVHISYLEQAKIQLQQHVEVLFSERNKQYSEVLSEILEEGYLKRAFELQKGFNQAFHIVKPYSEKQLETILKKPWAADGYNFSERIWRDKQQLIDTLQKSLAQNTLTGGDLKEAIMKLSRATKIAEYNARRLLETEAAFFDSRANKDCYDDLGVERFQFLAVLDLKTSQICQDLDAKDFPLSEWRIGENAPPMHCFCRSTTCPYTKDGNGLKPKRNVKVPGGSGYYDIPGDMNYKEWKRKYVDVEFKDLPLEAQNATIRSRIKTGYYGSNELVKGRQNKHIEGAKGYIPGRSILTEDPKKLFNEYFGTGRLQFNQTGSNIKEFIDAGQNIGIYKDHTTKITAPTSRFSIRYSKKGFHIVPARPKEG